MAKPLRTLAEFAFLFLDARQLLACGEKLLISPSFRSPQMIQAVLDSMNATGKADKLKGFEFVKRIIVEPSPFDQIKEAELMTPTFKLKRPQLLKHYQTQIDALYDEMKKGAGAN
jgi:long-subunit acyl-CoA synthetase (AMP-forming)